MKVGQNMMHRLVCKPSNKAISADAKNARLISDVVNQNNYGHSEAELSRDESF